ncbi:MAG TPA: OB-fold domain-containing protein, partial [Acidimicrobiia bacterium]|nr:OB-fold domain-containing protein [Acidimicrobiia bacterium]
MTPAHRGLIPPDIDADSAWWWEALDRGRLLLPRCPACERCFFPPLPACPHCGSARITAIPAGGRGAVYSWVVVHIALDPAFAGDIPYTVVAVDLDEGVRVFGRLHGEVAPAAGAP